MQAGICGFSAMPSVSGILAVSHKVYGVLSTVFQLRPLLSFPCRYNIIIWEECVEKYSKPPSMCLHSIPISLRFCLVS